MSELRERDAMVCRACGREERASEGYPCTDCGRFVCMICNLRGIVRCKDCAAKLGTADSGTATSDRAAGG